MATKKQELSKNDKFIADLVCQLLQLGAKMGKDSVRKPKKKARKKHA